MEKFTSFRIQKLENHKAKNALNHNIRKGWQPKYIDTSRSYKNYTLKGVKLLDLEAIKKEQQKRSKRKIQKNSTRFLSGIMTFSNSMKKDYDREIFDINSKDFLKKLEIHLGLKVLQAQVHLDETTPHIHIIFDNLDENGKTINRTITPEKLSQAQDLIGESFKNMGYKRGIDKNETNSKHLKISDYKTLKAKEEELIQSIKKLEKTASKASKSDERLDFILDSIETGEGKLIKEDWNYLVKHMSFVRRFAKKETQERINKKMSKGIKMLK